MIVQLSINNSTATYKNFVAEAVSHNFKHQVASKLNVKVKFLDK